MPASHDSPAGFGSAVDAAAADWYSERHETPAGPPSNPSRRSSENSASEQWASSHTQPAASHSRDEPAAATAAAATAAAAAPQIGSDITAWQTALQSLPPEFKDQPFPTHPLPASLAGQSTIRQIEWNPYRHQGGFVPRTAHDFASLMIFICGQINPNPCRNCLLRNGPFAKCVVSPPAVLAISTIRHACANCTYQNQYRKCTNEPITEEEMARRLYAKGSTARADPLLPRKPKVQTGIRGSKDPRKQQQQQQQQQQQPPPPPPPPQIQQAHPQSRALSQPVRSQARPQQQEQEQVQHHRHHNPYRHIIRKPSARSISVESFVDKLRQARSWSPRSRRRAKAEMMQWQAAIATVEAENPDSFPSSGLGSTKQRQVPQSTPAQISKSATPARFAPLPASASMEETFEMDEYEGSEMSEEEGDTWAGFGEGEPIT